MFEWVEDFGLICFDFDGLLVNTEELHYLAYKQMLSKYGFDLPWDFEAYCTEAHISTEFLRSAIYTLFPRLKELQPNWDVLRQEKNRLYANFIESHQLKLMDGVEELLAKLGSSPKLKTCVVTNSTKEQTDQIRSLLPELNQIPHWITREQYERAKPAPDGYLKALQLLESPKDAALGFEDTMKGANALIAAGISPVLIWPKNYPPKQGNESILLFHSFFEVSPHLKAQLLYSEMN